MGWDNLKWGPNLLPKGLQTLLLMTFFGSNSYLEGAPGIVELKWAQRLDQQSEDSDRQDHFSRMGGFLLWTRSYVYRVQELLTRNFHFLHRREFKNPQLVKNFQESRWILEKLESVQNQLDLDWVRLDHKIKYKRISLDESAEKQVKSIKELTGAQKEILSWQRKFLKILSDSASLREVEAERLLDLWVEWEPYLKIYNTARDNFSETFKDFKINP